MTKNIHGRVHICWSADMDDLLRAKINEGATFSEAARAINTAFGTSLTRNAAIGRASRIGLPGKGSPPAKARAYIRSDRPKRFALPPKPATKIVMRAVPVVSAKGNITFRMKPKTVLADDAIVSTPLELGPAAVSFFDAKPCHCRWPYGDPRDLETFRFCGETVAPDRPYCKPHQAQSRGQQ